MTVLLATASTALLAMHPGGDRDWFPWFPLIPLFFLALWVTVLVLFARRWRAGAGGWGARPGPSAEDVLAQRYARGEIDESEYRTRRAVLRSTQ